MTDGSWSACALSRLGEAALALWDEWSRRSRTKYDHEALRGRGGPASPRTRPAAESRWAPSSIWLAKAGWRGPALVHRGAAARASLEPQSDRRRRGSIPIPVRKLAT